MFVQTECFLPKGQVGSPHGGNNQEDCQLPRRAPEEQGTVLMQLGQIVPSLVEIVLAQGEFERATLMGRLESTAERIDTVLADATRRGDTGELLQFSVHIDDLRGRAVTLFAGKDLPLEVPRLSSRETIHLATDLWELRERFWRMLYEVPFVQTAVLGFLERASAGGGHVSRHLFAPRRLWIDGDSAARDRMLKERATSAMSQVHSVRCMLKENGDQRIDRAIADILISVPLIPEKNLELMKEYRSRRHRVSPNGADSYCELGLPCDNEPAFFEQLSYLEARYLRVRNYLVLANSGLSISRVRRFDLGKGIAEDLRQAAFVGLVSSIERFDPTIGFALSTNAESWIRKEAIDACRQEENALSVPRDRQIALFHFRNAGDDDGKIKELVKTGVVHADEVSDFAALSRPVRRLSEPLSRQSQSGSLGETIADEKASSVDVNLRQEDARGIVADLLRRIPASERDVVVLSFGLNGFERHTDTQIAERLKLSKEVVRGRRARALNILKIRVLGLSEVEL